jgi:phosphoglucomutase
LYENSGIYSNVIKYQNLFFQVVDSLQDYVDLMKEIFDFATIKEYLKTHKVLINSLHGGNEERKCHLIDYFMVFIETLLCSSIHFPVYKSSLLLTTNTTTHDCSNVFQLSRLIKTFSDGHLGENSLCRIKGDPVQSTKQN